MRTPRTSGRLLAVVALLLLATSSLVLSTQAKVPPKPLPCDPDTGCIYHVNSGALYQKAMTPYYAAVWWPTSEVEVAEGLVLAAIAVMALPGLISILPERGFRVPKPASVLLVVGSASSAGLYLLTILSSLDADSHPAWLVPIAGFYQGSFSYLFYDSRGYYTFGVAAAGFLAAAFLFLVMQRWEAASGTA